MTVTQAHCGNGATPQFDAELAPDWLMVLGHQSQLAGDNQAMAHLAEAYPDAVVTGCTTGNFLLDSQLRDEGVGATAIQLSDGYVDSYSIDTSDDPARDGRMIGEQIRMDGDPSGLLVFYDLSFPQPERFIRALRQAVGPGVSLSGAVASDRFTFDQTAVYDRGEERSLIVVAIFEEELSLVSSTTAGIEQSGCEYTITKSVGNVIHEIDGRPALDVFNDHLGDDFFRLPLAATHYPIWLHSEDGENSVVRCANKYGFARKSLTLGGDIPEAPCRITLSTYVDPKQLLHTGEVSALELANLSTRPQELNLYFGCAMRHGSMGDPLSEIEYQQAVRRLQPGTPNMGFFGNGQICHFDTPYRAEVHNLNVAITSLQV